MKETDLYDPSLEALLDLNGEVFPMDNGYWTKFEARRIDPDKHAPHGIRYSLTLHNKHNERVPGFDNSHGIKSKRRKYSTRKVTWDHKHRKEKISSYQFESAGQLLEDFWNEVERYLREWG